MPASPSGSTTRCQPGPVGVHQVNVVVVFGPVVSNEYRQTRSLARCGETCSSRRTPGGNLMDQCSVARHPISATGDLTNRPGHDLQLGIDHHPRFSLCSPAGGSVTSLRRLGRYPPKAR